MNEIWKDVVGYEGLYQVSNLGRIKRIECDIEICKNNGIKYTRKIYEKIICQSEYTNGYLGVTLCKNGNMNRFLVHRIVAISFIVNENNYSIVNHKDEDKKNNSVYNLEWCTQKYNINYSIERSFGKEKKSFRRNRKKVHQYLNGEIVGIYNSIMDIEKTLKFNHANISKCCNGFKKEAYGYEWKFC